MKAPEKCLPSLHFFLNVPALNQTEFSFPLAFNVIFTEFNFQETFLFSLTTTVYFELVFFPLSKSSPISCLPQFYNCLPLFSLLTFPNTLLSWAPPPARAILLGTMLSLTIEEELGCENRCHAYIFSSSSITNILDHIKRADLLFQQR